MKSLACMAIVLLSTWAHADAQDKATAQNSIPSSLWIEYSEREGVDFRLEHFTADRDPKGRSVTAYSLNWRYVDGGGWHEVKVSSEAWIRFREALSEAGSPHLANQKFDKAKVKAFWNIQIVYPDATISGSEADVESLQSDFALVRKAVCELTAGAIK